MFTLNPTSPDFLGTLEFLLKLLGAIGGLYLFFTGIQKYFKEQIWKRNEFVANEFKAFNDDRMARNAMYMLDWGERYIELFPDKEKYDERYAKVDRGVLKKALQYHELRNIPNGRERFTREEVAIRDTFDHFLSYFERFCSFIEARLVTKKELEPYINYWIETISYKMEENVRNVLHQYIDKYDFTGTQKLFLAFGKDIKPKTDIPTIF